ncbi:hypothetical protein ACIQUB_06020 [Rhizobium sp. NPDC090275]|uniref:hypothetical protein n=1 Tax=Rhizobium sp. NPDC090275 TaxID=3364498 RepID=UPI00383A7841
MPIRAERQALYPGGGTHSREWKAFRAEILQRAGNACEGTPMHPRAANGEAHPETGSKVVLTIAHMDHDERHADPARCRALCQRCHLRWDAQHHSRNAAATRRRAAALSPTVQE